MGVSIGSLADAAHQSTNHTDPLNSVRGAVDLRYAGRRR